MKDWLYPGAKVVCVDDTPGAVEAGNQHPLGRGRVYTIAAVTSEFFVLAVQLEEYPRTYTDDGRTWEGWLRANRFRPLRERKSDISIFKALLTPSDATEDA